MDIKTVNLVYFSATDVSKKYALAMGEATGKPIKKFDFTLPKNRIPADAPSFSNNDLVILSLPVYGGRIPNICLEYVCALKGNKTPCVVVGTYGNRDFDDAVAEMEDIMSDNGFIVVAGAAVIGRHSFSDEIAGTRPDTDDLNGAKNFIIKVLEKDVAPLEKGVIPGNRPYKEKSGAPNTFMPVTSDSCVNCKSCALRCPNGVISVENPKERLKDASACLRCNRCVVYCPVGAITFINEEYQKRVAGAIARFGKPDKDNRYFL